MEKHFSKFGRVVKVTVNPAREAAVIFFDNHESARQAKENGHSITPKLAPIEAIFYGKPGDKFEELNIVFRRKFMLKEKVNFKVSSIKYQLNSVIYLTLCFLKVGVSQNLKTNPKQLTCRDLLRPSSNLYRNNSNHNSNFSNNNSSL